MEKRNKKREETGEQNESIKLAAPLMSTGQFAETKKNGSHHGQKDERVERTKLTTIICECTPASTVSELSWVDWLLLSWFSKCALGSFFG